MRVLPGRSLLPLAGPLGSVVAASVSIAGWEGTCWSQMALLTGPARGALVGSP